MGTKSCYNCAEQVHIYAAVCPGCGAAHQPATRPKPKPKPREAGNVKLWLAENGFVKYIPAFEENGISLDLIPTLTSEDLKSIGIAKLGDRKRFLERAALPRIGRIKHDPSAPAGACPRAA